MAEPLLRVDGLTKRFGGLTASDAISLDVLDGELHAVIGPNGAGKTTFIVQLMGELKPDAGSIRFCGVDITRMSTPDRVHRGIGRTFQIVQLLPEATALANVAIAVQVRQGHSFRFWRNASADPSLHGPALSLLEEVGLGSRAHVRAGVLAHGEQRQLEIAVVLATEPQVLLLDEPLAGMGAAEAESMVALLHQLKKDHAMLLVEHDMDAVFALAEVLTVMVNGTVIATGTPNDIRSDAQVQAAYLGEESA
jgi:branched-chain amino acid transport system ATP-binding protein